MADSKKLTLAFEEAIQLGEYEPKFLAQYPEWHTMSRHVQFEYIRKALDNRRKQLLTHYAELSNALDFSKKPELKDALKKLEKQMHDLIDIKEKLYIEYTT